MRKNQLSRLSLLILNLFCIVFLGSCSQVQEEEKIRIAINPWPGYEFLYLAAEKGFFAANGLNIEIVELPSLADVQRVYIQGRVDGMASTVIEVVQAAGILQQPLDIVLVADFSNGGDVIISKEEISSIAQLKGKRVGTEIGSLGLFVLHVALKKQGLSLKDVDVINVEQLDAAQAMKNGDIDAIVTYPPYAIEINKQPDHRQIFSTTEIPEQVIDVVSIRAGKVQNRSQWLHKFHQVWQQTLDYAQTHQQEAYEIMARREGVTVPEFADALTGLMFIPTDQQQKLLDSTQLLDNVKEVCQVLADSKPISFGCGNINQLVRGMGSQ